MSSSYRITIWYECINLHCYRNFTHENLVKLYGVCSQQGPIFIVTELMKNGKHYLVFSLYVCLHITPSQGALLQYLRNRHDLITKTDVILDMALQICSAMQFLESIKFIHRDLVCTICDVLCVCVLLLCFLGC